MVEKSNWKEDLLNEKDLLAVYRLGKELPHKKFNTALLIVFPILSGIVAFSGLWEVSEILTVTRSIIESGFDVSINLLGFLLAGFTVFTSIYKSELMLFMAKEEKEGTGLSYLKYNMYHFMKLFIVLLIFCFVCFILKILSVQNGFLSGLAISFKIPYQTKAVLIKIAFMITTFCQFYILICLKALIFNIYHIIMTSIRWDAENG